MEAVTMVLAGIGMLAGVFLVSDAVLALILGKRYMLWGLEYTPKEYSDLIHRIAALPTVGLLTVKTAELSLGLALFLVAVFLTFG